MNAESSAQIAGFLLAVELVLQMLSLRTGAQFPTPLVGDATLVPAVAARPAKPTLPAGARLTKHFLERMAERGVTAEQVVDILRTGRRYYDPRYGEFVYWKSGVYIPVANDGALKTVVRGPVNRKWRPL